MIICQQAIINVGGSTTRSSVATTNQYQNGRCTLAALMGGDPTAAESSGSDPTSVAVSNFITSRDHDNSPPLKPLSPPSDDTVTASAAGGGSNKISGHDGKNSKGCVMSYLSLPTMSNEERNNNGPDEKLMVNHDGALHDEHYSNAIIDDDGQYQQQEQKDSVSILPCSSIATRAAFHELPPSLYPDDDDQQQANDDRATLSFLDTLQTSPFSDPDDYIPLRDSTMANDQLDGIFSGGVDCCADDDDVASSHAVLSSLYQMCSTEGKPPLDMFESALRAVERVGCGGTIKLLATTATYHSVSMKDELSDFRSFGASVMVDKNAIDM
mmetsp:Transcript_23547/g.51007  ORF Transcript_23547/g.51007 Transcript_23547/m.51007 type:complete len:326 (-) Transcript_23547:54-1031(-)|eukprot:CAMPEP_0172311946 /NCGR_PEP_ID=MMETSP1058-20130122/16166_1 /TAXON_ID=83371 /ORGANISM="Detonula confervacea, Strain CCMP 353" /LENGTH=325 /DNA_ID=CAMNT_0013025267 /DNA_START=162 /DNA_END=1139 /DNA_ORIENTATION=+